MGRRFWVVVALLMLSQSLLAKDIVVGVEPIPKRNFAIVFTPIVLLDVISAKAAFEYRIHEHINLVVPLEGKWMDYGAAIRYFGTMGGAKEGFLENFYREDQIFRLGWNLDFMQYKISSGLGIKYYPLNDSMGTGFFIKPLFMVGYEHFSVPNANKEADKQVDSAVFTGVLTVGFNWVMHDRFSLGFEGGAEYTWHTNPMKDIPILIKGFMPVLQLSLGFTI